MTPSFLPAIFPMHLILEFKKPGAQIQLEFLTPCLERPVEIYELCQVLPSIRHAGFFLRKNRN